jgi:hypothetical protein
MKNFIVEHSIVKGGWFLDKKLNFVQYADNAHIWENEEEFNAVAVSAIGRHKAAIRQKIFKFVAFEDGEKIYKTFKDAEKWNYLREDE